jgi:hypothetical protein
MCRCMRWIASPITPATEDELEEAYDFPGVAPGAVCDSDVSELWLAPSDVMLRALTKVRLITC